MKPMPAAGGASGLEGETPMPNLLAVSFHFFPSREARAIQVTRLMSRLTLPAMIVHQGELDAPPPPPAAAQRHYVPVPFLLHAPAQRLRALARKAHLPLFNVSPDAYRSWMGSALAAARASLQKSGFKPQVVASFAQPPTDHLIAMRLARELGLPWVAHFSDPWVALPWHHRRRDPLTQWVVSRQERLVMERADLVLFTCREQVDMIMAPYPARLRTKARILPHCCEAAEFAGLEPLAGPDGERVLRYLGIFYFRRTPAPLIEGLRLIQARTPRLLDGLAVELIGDTPADLARRHSGEGLPPGLIRYLPPVPHRQALGLMLGADGLLVIDAPAKRNVFFPSKLADYLGSDRPVLGITPPGPSRRLIRRMGGLTADPDRPEEVARALSALLERGGRDASASRERMQRLYSAERRASLFARYLRQAVERHRAGE